MSTPASRRGFLSGLATLPLIGGSVALIGSPSAVAAPINGALLDSYSTWLFYERRWLQFERYGSRGDLSLDGRFAVVDTVTGRPFDYVSLDNPAGHWHGRDEAPASTRAALILSAAGCGWREGGR